MARLTDSFGGSAGGAFFGPSPRGRKTSALGIGGDTPAPSAPGFNAGTFLNNQTGPTGIPKQVLPPNIGSSTGGYTPALPNTKAIVNTVAGLTGTTPAGEVGQAALNTTTQTNPIGSTPTVGGDRGGDTPVNNSNTPVEDPGAGTGGYANQGDGGSGVLQKGTQDAINTIDGSISELRAIANQSLADPEMMAIVNNIMAQLNSSLASVQSELQAWYSKMGDGQQDLGLQGAISILQEEINNQKAQLEESLNSRGLLQSGIMAAAEAKIRSGGLDRIQSLVANRLSELSGIIMQSVTSLAQSRMAGMTSIATAGLSTIGGMAQAREGTRGTAITAMGKLYGDKAQVQQQGAVNLVTAAQGQQELAQTDWYNRERVRLEDEQNRITQSYNDAALSLQRDQMQPTATQGAGEIYSVLQRVKNDTLTQEDFDENYQRFLQTNPDYAGVYRDSVLAILEITGKRLPTRGKSTKPLTDTFNPSSATDTINRTTGME